MKRKGEKVNCASSVTKKKPNVKVGTCNEKKREKKIITTVRGNILRKDLS